MTSNFKQNPIEPTDSFDEFELGEITEYIGQAWCLCPYECWIDDYITIQSNKGWLALCAVMRVVNGPNKGEIRYEPLTKIGIHDLSANTKDQTRHD